MTVTASRDQSSDFPGYAGPSGLDGTLTIHCFKSRGVGQNSIAALESTAIVPVIEHDNDRRVVGAGS
jgi:hypothetical protein